MPPVAMMPHCNVKGAIVMIIGSYVLFVLCYYTDEAEMENRNEDEEKEGKNSSGGVQRWSYKSVPATYITS